MKVIKRDGRAVEYEKEKIEIAIEKANNEVRGQEKATKEEIASIIDYIEDLGKKRILVEDIQDIIEQKLMEFGKYNLAKKYIVYRYTRALVRKKNTTDESVLRLIKDQSKNMGGESSTKNAVLASIQRDLIAGEVSKDLTKRILLPEKISKAHEEGILYFHDAEYFLQQIINSSFVNLEDMLDNGTVINEKLIETPKSFKTAISITNEIILAIGSSQYGEQLIDIKCLGKYLRKSREKFKKEIEKINEHKELSNKMVEKLVMLRLKEELSSGVQNLEYQINIMTTSNGKSPDVTLLLNLDKDDKYIKENAMIIEEILNQRYKGIKNESGEYVTPEFPRLIYILDELNDLNGGKYDYLTKLAVKCSAKRIYPECITAKQMNENNVNYKFEGRFNQGVVTINLAQIGQITGQDEEKFWVLLDERLELCKEALMCRHYALLGTSADTSPIHWRYGGIASLEKGEKIDKLLKNGYSSLSLGYVGLYEAVKAVKGVSNPESKGKEFETKIMKKLNERINKWKKETGIDFNIVATRKEP